MASVKRAGRVALFGATVGAGLVIGAGAAAATAEASPTDATNHGSVHSSSVGHHAPAPKSATKADSKNSARKQTITLSTPTAPQAAATTITTTPRLTLVGAADTPAASTAVKPAAAQALKTPVASASIAESLQDLVQSITLAVQHQIEGIRYNLTVLGTDLARIFGISRGTPGGPPDTPTVFGDPATNKKYWAPAPDFITGALATVAMAYGQLTGTTPDVQKFIDQALITDSQSPGRTGKKVYEGPGTTNVVKWADANDLLATASQGVRVITRNYPASQEAKALNSLEAALQDPKQAVIALYWGPIDGQDTKDWKPVLMLGVDTANDTVEFNDPTVANGQDIKMSLKEFVRLWKFQSYQTVTVQLADLPTQASSAESVLAA